MIIIIALPFGLYYMQNSIKQNEQLKEKEVAIQSYKDHEETILGVIYNNYPTEGAYLYGAGVELKPGLDENYDKLKEQERIARENPHEFLTTFVPSGELYKKSDGSYYNNYFEMLKAENPVEYERIKSNNYLDWQTRNTKTIRKVYGWRGIQVENENENDIHNTYYVEFAFDTINTDMSDGYSRYAFEVSILPKTGAGQTKIIYGSKYLQEKYKEYYDAVW